MKKSGSLLMVLAAALVMTATCACAAEGGVAVSATAGTLGAGGEIAGRINPNLNARLGLAGFGDKFKSQVSGIDYEFKMKLLNGIALLDWFPFSSSGFRLSGGVVVNDNTYKVDATGSANYDVNGVTYSAAQVGTLSGKVEFNKVAPYAGLGWGNPFLAQGHWSLAVDIGAFYQGSPDVKLDASGPIASNPAFQANLDAERANLEDKGDKFRFYPVAMVAVTYRF